MQNSSTAFLWCDLTWLKYISSQALHKLSWPRRWCRLSHLSFKSECELKAKTTGPVWPCKSNTHTHTILRSSTWASLSLKCELWKSHWCDDWDDNIGSLVAMLVSRWSTTKGVTPLVWCKGFCIFFNQIIKCNLGNRQKTTTKKFSSRTRTEVLNTSATLGHWQCTYSWTLLSPYRSLSPKLT